MSPAPANTHTLRARLDALRSARGLPAAHDRSALADLPADIASALSPSLTERLARLRPWAHGDRVANLSESDVAARVGGTTIAPGVIRVERRYRLPYRHGRVTLGSAATRAHADLTPVVFLDTETNGLAGGTGTIAFVVGITRLEDAQVHITQWLLTAFAGERALLTDVIDAIPRARAATLVTYNGASFDLPLLRTRMRLQGLSDHFADRAHLDLLYWARRVRPHEWPDARLQTIEQRGIGFERIDDLPGEAVPRAWQQWLRCGDAAALAKVLEHNRDDLLSLAALHALFVAHPHAERLPTNSRQTRLFQPANPWASRRLDTPFVRAPFRSRATATVL